MDNKELTEIELLLKEQRIAFFEKYGEVPELVRIENPKMKLEDMYDWYKAGKESFVLFASKRHAMSV